MAKANIVEQVFSPIGQGIRGMARGLFPGAATAADLQTQQIRRLLDSEAGQDFLRRAQAKMYEARAVAMDRGEGYYGGRGVDPYVQGAENLGKIRKARDAFGKDELTPETSAYFDAAEKSVLDRMESKPQDKRGYLAPGDETDVFEALSKRNKSRDMIISPKQRIPTDIELQGMLPAETVKDETGVFKSLSRRPLADYFQASTPTIPEENIPKTYPQLGITNVDDMATLDEMQKALPEVDMRQVYQDDPEMMKMLIELWKSKKVTKRNLHEAFKEKQMTAQQALGIR